MYYGKRLHGAGATYPDVQDDQSMTTQDQNGKEPMTAGKLALGVVGLIVSLGLTVGVIALGVRWGTPK